MSQKKVLTIYPQLVPSFLHTVDKLGIRMLIGRAQSGDKYCLIFACV